MDEMLVEPLSVRTPKHELVPGAIYRLITLLNLSSLDRPSLRRSRALGVCVY